MTAIPDPIDDGLCGAEYPGDDMHVGQLCEEPAGHDQPPRPTLHRHDAAIGRIPWTLVWGQP